MVCRDSFLACALRVCATARHSLLLPGVRSVRTGPSLEGGATGVFFAGLATTCEVARTQRVPLAAKKQSAVEKSCGMVYYRPKNLNACPTLIALRWQARARPSPTTVDTSLNETRFRTVLNGWSRKTRNAYREMPINEGHQARSDHSSLRVVFLRRLGLALRTAESQEIAPKSSRFGGANRGIWCD